MSGRYMVRGSPVNVVATIEHLGLKFRLSRPVDKDGQRRRQGWMLSHDGRAMALLKDCEQDAALATFKTLLGGASSRAELDAAVEKTARDAADLQYR